MALQEVHREKDEWGELSVVDDGAYRYLCFAEGDEQSCQLKAQPQILQHEYTQAMCLALLISVPKNVVILGLGGGCLVSAIHHCLPGVKIRAVELRPQVVDVAYRHFRLPRSKRLQIIIDDAIDFIARDEVKKTDILFADLYTGDGVDNRQTEQAFIRRCHSLLKSEGVLVLNCWREHRYEYAIQEVLTALFVEVWVCVTGSGNWVIIASRRPSAASNKQLKQRAQQLSQQLGFNLTAMLARMQPLSAAVEE
ncbi:spermidine synthase [Sinobacterium caligoides]|uniref:Spermidine synthase n=1 Tax=Sinobacterium caligoides TaxID=933926 RepID=A0A3N2DG61_9GAMM|nr:spermidine synthase [Sinobacterium caligoides]ROR98711.1 spermidine synthase [Sinobacterium caligoides]